MERIFNLEKDNLKLKIEINDKNIITSWLHFGNTEFLNHRKFNTEDVKFSFKTLKPVLNNNEFLEVEKFMFKKDEGEQFSLF